MFMFMCKLYKHGLDSGDQERNYTCTPWAQVDGAVKFGKWLYVM